MSLALTLIIAVCRFVCLFSGALLAVASGIVFIIALLGLILPMTKLLAMSYVMMFALAFLISPFGISRFADWLLDKLESLNMAIRSI